MTKKEILALLNAPTPEERLKNLRMLLEAEEVTPVVRPEFANNHIHTTHSFSPYSPTAAVYFARAEGLNTCGIMDHDSIAGAREFREAGKIADMGTTCGFEARVSLAGTPFENRRTNHPDQAGAAYMAFHSVPCESFDRAQERLRELARRRNERNRSMVDRVNEIMAPYGIELDFDRDVLPISSFEVGGSVTERHLLYALSLKIIEKVGRENVLSFLENELDIHPSQKVRNWLMDVDSEHFAYDLLGVMKSELNTRVYIPADDEMMTLAEAVAFADEIGCTLCYAYLGDIGDSVTGDKKAAKFEDDYLEELLEYLREAGVKGVTYMPSRNTEAQLDRLMALCDRLGFTQISGEDINSSRQSFICRELANPKFRHLVDAAWKLVNQEVREEKKTMKTRAVRLYGKEDLRLETFELPAIRDDEILAKVICDSICMSTYKAAEQGADHKRVPDDVAENPVIVGHEFCGEILQVGSKWQSEFKPGERFAIQPNINYKGTMWSPGYSFRTIGGDATYIVIPNQFMECGCLLPYHGEAFFGASLSEPLSCVAGTFKAMYHTTNGVYEHKMGIKEHGKMAILAGVGPMGLASIDYILHTERRPSFLVVTDIDQARLDRAASIFTVEEAKRMGVELHYVNTGAVENPAETLMQLSGGTGYDDVIVFAPVPAVVEQGDAILGRDGCLNFFAGPARKDFYAKLNFYNVHYMSAHICGTSGGNNDDMAECLKMMGEGRLTPAALVTHIGGIDAVIDTTLNLPRIPGGKKLIYTHINLPLTAISDFEEKGKTDPMFKKLHELTQKTNGLWNKEAEDYLLNTLAKEDCE